jgi:hypothetical protein
MSFCVAENLMLTLGCFTSFRRALKTLAENVSNSSRLLYFCKLPVSALFFTTSNSSYLLAAALGTKESIYSIAVVSLAKEKEPFAHLKLKIKPLK